MPTRQATFLAAALMAGTALVPRSPAQGSTVALAPDRLSLKNVKAESITFKGRPCLQLSDPGKGEFADGSQIAILPGLEFQDGAIEVDIAGDTLPAWALPSADSPGWRSAWLVTPMKHSTCAPRTGVAKIRNSAFIRPNTSPPRLSMAAAPQGDSG